VLQGCYRGVAGVLQGSCRDVTGVLQGCYRSSTEVMQECVCTFDDGGKTHKRSGVEQQWVDLDSVVLQWCHSVVTMLLQCCDSFVTVL
jgi:hypothetical protein